MRHRWSVLCVVAFAPLLVTSATTHVAARRETLDVYFIDVEGGQSTLLVTPDDESLLIDAGFPGTGTFASTPGAPADARDPQRILAAAHDAGIQRIDHLMLTHYHADHAGGVPELARLIPIVEYIDHAAPLPEADAAVPGTQAVYDRYVLVRASSAHIDPKPGEQLPIKGVDATVVSSLGATLDTPVGGSGAPHAACAGQGLPAQEKTENPRSLGVFVRFGAFRFLDVGDLSGPPLFALTCPVDKIGTADVYLVAHHGGVDAADAAMFATVKPRVAVFNNGPRKGGAAETFATLAGLPGIDVWQLHRAGGAGVVNAPDERIANLDETASAWIKISARRDGSFTVTNGRTVAKVSYAARK
jgi:competence protein ComEC